MICQPCRDQHHEKCKGQTHCTCQHRKAVVNAPTANMTNWCGLDSRKDVAGVINRPRLKPQPID